MRRHYGRVFCRSMTWLCQRSERKNDDDDDGKQIWSLVCEYVSLSKRVFVCVKLPMRVIEPGIKFNNCTTITIRHHIGTQNMWISHTRRIDLICKSCTFILFKSTGHWIHYTWQCRSKNNQGTKISAKIYRERSNKAQRVWVRYGKRPNRTV